MNLFYRKTLSVIMAAVFCLSIFTGCEALDTSLPPEEKQEETKKKRREAQPEKAIEQIYANIGKRTGLVEPTPAEIETDLGISIENLQQVYVRYVETDFGADDVYILLPKQGEDEQGIAYKDRAIDDLRARKDTRTREFANYDVYNSTAIAEGAVIFERGGYVVMLMLEDNDSARKIIERYIPEKLNIS